MMNIDVIYDKKNIFAVAGASEDHGKYGYQVYKMLKDADVVVFPVNPNRNIVDGDKSYPNTASLPQKPDVLSIVTPPHISLNIVTDAISEGIKNIWLQPGAWDENILEVFKQHPDINGIYGKCILIENKF